VNNGGHVRVTGSDVSNTTNTRRLSTSDGTTAYITLDNATIRSQSPPIMVGANTTLYLTLIGENSLTATNAATPGIQLLTGATLIITEASTGSLTVQGGNDGYGIGGFVPHMGNVVINGGTVIALGAGTGAGIGSGTFTLNGNALVFANAVSDASERTSGILVIGATTHWYGENNITIDYNAVVPAGRTLTIAAGATLTIAAGATLTNNGTITIMPGGAINICGDGWDITIGHHDSGIVHPAAWRTVRVQRPGGRIGEQGRFRPRTRASHGCDIAVQAMDGRGIVRHHPGAIVTGGDGAGTPGWYGVDQRARVCQRDPDLDWADVIGRAGALGHREMVLPSLVGEGRLQQDTGGVVQGDQLVGQARF